MKLEQVPTPAYVIDLAKLEENCSILQEVQEKAGCKVLLAQKAYSLYKTYPLISQYLSGTTASGLYEAKLAREEFPGEVHVFAPAFKESDMEELLQISDHIVFNSERQLRKYGQRCREAGISVGLRINPQCSTQGDQALYDPCAPGSRFGVTLDKIPSDLLELVDGLHFHTLCEQGADDLQTTLKAVEEQFGAYLHQVKWLNMGGGHHITRDDYDVELLISEIKRIRETYNLDVYVEPGEAIALNAGYLATEVLDIVENGIETLVLKRKKNLILIDSLQILVLQGISLGITALKNRLKSVIASILKTWLFTPLSKIIPLMVLDFQVCISWIKRVSAVYSKHLATKTLRRDYHDGQPKEIRLSYACRV